MARPCFLRCMGGDSWMPDDAEGSIRHPSLAAALRYIERTESSRRGYVDGSSIRWWIYYGTEPVTERHYPDLEVTRGPRGGIHLEHC